MVLLHHDVVCIHHDRFYFIFFLFYAILNSTFSFCYLTIPELITMITNSCSCLFLLFFFLLFQFSLFTLLPLLSSVSVSEFSLSLSRCFCHHPLYRVKEKKKFIIWKNTMMGNFSLFSHDNDFHFIIVFKVFDGNF